MNPAKELIRKSVKEIQTAMIAGKFNLADLEAIKKLFTELIRLTDLALDRGPLTDRKE